MNQPIVLNAAKSATKPGYVYKISFPNGKSYIGQTIRDPEQRLKEHIGSAKSGKGGCRVLNRAFRKHNYVYVHEILLMAPENTLDHYEDQFIKLYDTNVKGFGYNLRDGGNGACNEEMRRQMVIGNDKKLASKSWPDEKYPRVKYVYWYHEINKHGTALEGWRVSDHPRGRRKVFADSAMDMDAKYLLAVEYKTFLDSYEGYYDEREKLPMYMGRYRNTGYKVRYPGVKSRYFKSDDPYQDRADAYDYLISVCEDHDLDRVFKDCVIH